MSDVLYLAQQGNAECWRVDFEQTARDAGLSAAIFDHDAPMQEQFEGVAVVVDEGGHASKDMIDAGAAAGVRLWQVLGTGLDHTEVEHIQSLGIALANTPGQFSAVALAEHALLMILALAKRLPEAEQNLRAGQMYHPIADELSDQLLGIVGFGASGTELAKRAYALGMRVQAVDVVPVPLEPAVGLRLESVAALDGLDDLLSSSDYVSLHIPLTADTYHLIDERRIGLLKPTAGLVNVARGRLVDELALARALARGAFRGAGLDVFGDEPLSMDHPLLSLNNVVLTPHTAGTTRGTSRRRSQAAVQNALRVLDGEDPVYAVPVTSALRGHIGA